MNMNVYFADKRLMPEELLQVQQKAFNAADMNYFIQDWQTEEEIIREAQAADAIILVAAPISGKVIESLPRLKFLGRCGIGVDSIDLETATRQGVLVCNVPDYCVEEVATHAIALLLNFNRQLKVFAQRAKNGVYLTDGVEVSRLKGKVFGCLGFGKIAREAAKMAVGLGMKVMVYDPYVQEFNDFEVKLTSLQELLPASDYLSVHAPLTPETQHIIGAKELAAMKKSAVIINTSRGGLIDKQALYQALVNGTIAGAGLDVCEGEPLPPDDALLALENVLYTSHVAMYSKDSMRSLHQTVVSQAIDGLLGKWPANVVNQAVSEVWKQKNGIK
jgi:D-3-phosphoglycerate dehydrogenase